MLEQNTQALCVILYINTLGIHSKKMYNTVFTLLSENHSWVTEVYYRLGQKMLRTVHRRNVQDAMFYLMQSQLSIEEGDKKIQCNNPNTEQNTMFFYKQSTYIQYGPVTVETAW